jgi:hypothetical protein
MLVVVGETTMNEVGKPGGDHVYALAPLAVRVADVTEPVVQILLEGETLSVVGGGKERSIRRLIGLQIPSGVIEIEY